MPPFRVFLRLALLLPLLLGGGMAAAQGDPFALEVAAADERSVELRFDIAPGYALYRDRFEFRLAGGPQGARLGPAVVPPGVRRVDPVLGTVDEVLVGRAVLRLPVEATGDGRLRIDVGYQGCTELGVCLAPREAAIELMLRDGRIEAVTRRGGDAPAVVAAPGGAEVEQALRSGSRLAVAAVFLGAGLLLSLTPCMLPMVPIVASIVLGPGAAPSRGRGFALALAYTLGLAAVYTVLGVAAGLLGEGLASMLQSRWAIAGFALVLVALALSMFGLFDLQLAGALQDRVAALSSRLPGGRLTAVFAMGGLSALLVGPCVAAPLAGALLFIGRTQDVGLGALALFCLAIGMGLPLLLVGLSAGALRLRAGPWTLRVKQALGVLLLGIAAWVASPLLPGDTAGPAAGGPDAAFEAEPDAAGFHRVRSVAQLDAALQRAGRPAVVFFSADWCLSCLRLERATLRDAAVRARLEPVLRLRVDLTRGGDAERELLRRRGLYGPPAVLFHAADGREIGAARVIGFEPPERFLAAAARAGL